MSSVFLFLMHYSDWIVSITTLIQVELMIHKKWYAWLFSLANQAVWLMFILSKAEYGLLPLNIAMWIQGIRGLRSWLRNKELVDAAKDRLSSPSGSPAGQAPDARV